MTTCESNFYEETGDMDMGGFRGSVGNIVRSHNEEQEVDTHLYRLNRSLDVTCTNGTITGCYNMINS